MYNDLRYNNVGAFENRKGCNMEAVILAGGFGTRLAHVVSDVPKPMAPINGKPFLQILLDDLAKKGVSRVILAVGYKKECIMHYFENSYNGLDIDYSIEDKPLFTGGAIKKALQMCKEDNVVIANGDTFFNVDIVSMLEAHMANAADLTIAAKRMSKFERYGTLKINSNGVIQGFCEKQY
ncbi:MAG: sugar phosphate nucleotidyltransferase, partial [Christensenella sp.]